MNFKIIVDDRKEVVRKLEELMESKATYTRMPRCAYEIGSFSVEKDMTLEAEDGADMAVLRVLHSEGLIEGDIPEGQQTETADEATEEPVGEAETEAAEETDTEDSDAQIAEAETEEAEETETEEAGDTDAETEEAETSEETDAETEEDSVEASEPLSEAVKPSISFPMNKHTGASLRNLVFTIYSRGSLLSKATGGNFHVDDGIVDALKDDSTALSYETFARAIADYEDEHGLCIEGLTFEPEKVTFTGFPSTDDPAVVRAFTELAAGISKTAITQKRVQAKVVNEENEKFAMRTWLIRIGMKGADYKETRKILLKDLSGNSAFLTAEDAERFKAKQKAKRDAEKAAREEQGE